MVKKYCSRNGIFWPSATVYSSAAIAIRHSRHPRCKTLRTFGQKSLIVSFTTLFNHTRILVSMLALMFICGCAQQKDIKHMTFSGTIELTEHVLGAKAAGRLTTLSVDEGNFVKKGQLLATLDRFEQSKKDYVRVDVLYKNGGANQQTLEYARLTMEDQQIISPIDGVVLIKDVETGEIIPAGGGVVVIADPHDQWVKIYVSEDMVHQLVLNQQASIAVDGSAQAYKGHVTFIADKAEFTPRNVQTPEERVTQTIAVKITIDNPDENLHAGTSADVRF
jgi:multidrug resistance efflux pump